MKYIAYIVCILSLIGCKKTDWESREDNAKSTLSISLFIKKEALTRTELQSSENHQHVQDVYLYIFEEVQDDAICIATENVKWSQPQGESASQLYTLEIELEQGKSYQLLAIGLDDKSGETFNLPQAIGVGTMQSEAKATLHGDKNTTHLGQSELFAGTAMFTPTTGYHPVSIELTRQVAGVLAYFKNIPYEISTQRVAYVQVLLHTNQNSSIHLMNPEYSYGTIPIPNSNVLLEMSVGNYLKSSLGNFYAIPPTDNAKLRTVENSLLMGKYLLPLAGSLDNSKSTLEVKLLDGNKNILRTYNIQPATPNSKNYPIHKNHFYSLGIKTTSLSTKDDQPLDLIKEQKLEIIVNPNWENSYDIGLIK